MTNRVSIRGGTEGPRHDPYSFREISVERNQPHFTGTVTVHIGLAMWMETRVPGRRPMRYEPGGTTGEARVARAFESLAGMSIKTAEAVPDRLRARRIRAHACGPEAVQWIDGYAGETLLICSHCGEFFGGEFDRSAVE